MKATSVATGLLLSACFVIAQGTINFNNDIPGQVVAPIYGPESGDNTLFRFGNSAAGYPAGTQVYTGVPLAGAGWSAQLLGAPGNGQPEGTLVSLSPVTTFRNSGFINPVTFAPIALPPGTTFVTYQMVAWNNLGGTLNDWSAAGPLWQAGQIAAAKSPLYVGPASGDTTFLRSFNVVFVPEPSSLAIIAVAGLGIILRRVLAQRRQGA